MDSVIDGIDYGPLAGLLGQWSGNKGLDVSPDNQAQDDKTAFTDDLTFKVAGAAENAEEQQLVPEWQHVGVSLFGRYPGPGGAPATRVARAGR